MYFFFSDAILELFNLIKHSIYNDWAVNWYIPVYVNCICRLASCCDFSSRVGPKFKSTFIFTFT